MCARAWALPVFVRAHGRPGTDQGRRGFAMNSRSRRREVSVWREDLMCCVVSLAYDFRSRTGRLCMEEGDCCDMQGCLDLFRKIDPNVEEVITFSGQERDTVYRKENKDWKAYCS